MRGGLMLVGWIGCASNPTLPATDSGMGSDTGQLGAGFPEAWAADELEVFRIVNLNRSVLQVCGSDRMPMVRRLSWNDQLRDAARAHSENMARRGFFAHDAPNGSTPADRAVAAGYPTRDVGENIAMGSATPADVMVGWMDSPGHCSNIMESTFTEIGVGLYEHRGVRYWTQVFGAGSPGR